MKNLTALAVISILGITVYANSLNNGFVFDDRALVANNEYIRDVSFIPKMLTTDLHYKETGGKGLFYRPAQNLSFMCDYAVWGLKPFGFHLTNTLLHILNAILVYFLIISLFRRLPQANTMAFACSLLFVIHPVHTQAVSYISGRADLLAAFFFLSASAAFIGHMRVNGRTGRCYYLGSVILFILGLLSKETVVILPLALLLYARLIGFWQTPPVKIKLKDLYVFFAVVGLYLILRSAVLGETTESVNPHNLYIRFLTFLKAIAVYLRLLVAPFDLHIERGLKVPASFFESQVLLSVVLMAAIWRIVVKVKSQAAYFGFLWFFLLLLPASNIIPLNADIAEHWLYLPSIGFFLFLAAIAVKKIPRRFKTASFVFLIILCSLSLVTIKQNNYWRNDLSLFKRALAYSPNNSRLHNNLGIVYFEKGETGEAISHFEEALRIRPNYRDAYYNLGKVYAFEGRYKEAKQLWKEALRIDPNYPACRQALKKLEKTGL